jgi:hypothetical protein
MASLAAALGLLLAWVGLFLPWRHWSAEAGDGSVNGFHESTAFWIALAIVTVLALAARFARVSLRDRERRWVHGAVAVGALALVAIAVRAIAGYLSESSDFVSVGPGIGALLSLLGALILLASAVVAFAPAHRERVQVLAASVLIVAGVAALWPAADGRPADGAIAEFSQANVRGLAFHDGTLIGIDEVYLVTMPRAGRDYAGYTLRKAGWFDSIAEGFAYDIAFAGDDVYAVLGNSGRVGVLNPSGKATVAPGATHVLAVAPAPGGIYLLTQDGVSVLRDQRVTEVASIDLDAPRDIASDGDGGVFVADTGNGRVLHMDVNGRVKTVVGTQATRGCVKAGRDDPLTLDPRRCTGAVAVAGDDDGNLYLALHSAGMVLGVTPEGRMAVVAGTGPAGWSDGDGQAVQAHLGQVNGLEVGPDGDLYIDEDHPIQRVRRVADPASLLDDPRPKPAAPVTTGACGAIAAVRESFLSASTRVGDAIAALDRSAPDEIRDRVDDFIADYERHRDSGDPLTDVIWFHNGYKATLADYAEDECRLVAGYNLTADAVNRFCLAYGRYLETHRTLGEESPEWTAVQDAAPRMLNFINPRVVDKFTSSVCVAP